MQLKVLDLLRLLPLLDQGDVLLKARPHITLKLLIMTSPALVNKDGRSTALFNNDMLIMRYFANALSAKQLPSLLKSVSSQLIDATLAVVMHSHLNARIAAATNLQKYVGRIHVITTLA